MRLPSFSPLACILISTVLFACSLALDSGDSASSRAAGVELRYGTATVSSGGTLDLGSALIGNSKDLTLAIRNKGSKYLILSGSPAIAFDGEGASQFVLKTSSFPAILPVGGYLPFKVRFTPASLGTKDVMLKIDCNDGSSSAFKVTVSCLAYKIPVTGITLSPTALPLMVGETGLLTATVVPANATYSGVTWASADPAVATVSDAGLVTGIAVGSTTITVTTDAGEYGVSFPISVYTPYNPTSWTDVAAGSSSPYTARRYHQSLGYNGKLYVIGGNRVDDAILNDVWSSSDGKNWTNILPQNVTPGPTQFPKRRHHSCLVFKGKMWVVAGEDWSGTGLPMNDVWSSTDGIAWTQVLADTDTPGPNQFSQRSFVSLTTDGVKMYVLGGYLKNPGPNNNFSNDVWSSTDGAAWTRIRADGAAGGFTARMAAGAYILNGVLYIFGGDGNDGTVGDLWSSIDGGAAWTQLADPGVGLRADFGLASYAGKLWIVGGYKPGYVAMNDLWSSPDGVAWTEVLADGNSVYPKRFGTSMAVFDDKLLILGGYADGTFYNDVWQVQ